MNENNGKEIVVEVESLKEQEGDEGAVLDPEQGEFSLVRKLLVTLFYYFIFFTFAMYCGSLGPALYDMIDVCEDCSLTNISWVYVSRGAGTLTISFSVNFIFDFLQVNKHPFRWYNRFLSPHTVVSVLMGLNIFGIIFTPFCVKLWMLCIVFYISGVLFSSTVNTLTKCMVTMFPTSTKYPLQLFHAFFGVGALIYPGFCSLVYSFGFQSQTNNVIIFWIAALLQIPSLFLIFVNPPTIYREKKPKTDRGCKKVCRKVSGVFAQVKDLCHLEVVVIVIQAIVLSMYVGAEGSFSGLISLYLYDSKLYGKSVSAIATSVFFLSFTVGRFFFFALTFIKGLRPHFILLINFSMTLFSTFLFILFYNHKVMVWVGIVLIGFFMSSSYGLVYILPLSLFEINIVGMPTNIIILGGSIGMFFPFFSSYCFSLERISFPIIIACFFLVMVFLFSVLYCTSVFWKCFLLERRRGCKYVVDRKKGPQTQMESTENDEDMKAHLEMNDAIFDSYRKEESKCGNCSDIC